MSGPGWSRWIGPVWLAVILLLAAVAPFIAPRPPELQEDVAGARYLAPFARAHALTGAEGRLLIVTALHATPGGWEYIRAGRTELMPAAQLRGAPAARFYLLGTDSLGRDLEGRVLYGLRHSVGISWSRTRLK